METLALDVDVNLRRWFLKQVEYPELSETLKECMLLTYRPLPIFTLLRSADIGQRSFEVLY